MRKTLLSTLALAVLLGAASVGAAQEAKPLVTVAFSGYDKLIANVEYIGKLGGNAELAKGLEDLLKKMTGSEEKGLPGLDASKPWCAVVQAKGQEFPMFAFVPVTDLKKLVEALGRLGVEAKDEAGVFQIDTPARPVFVTAKGGWAVVGASAESLKDAPADPMALLGDLYKRYDLVVQGSAQNVPEEMRTMFVAQLEAGMQMGMRRRPGESEEEYAIRSNLGKQALQQLTTAVNELDTILIGWAVDQKTNSTYLDVEMKAVAGSKLAQEMATLGEAKTNFAGFDLPGAAAVANWAGTLADSDVAQMKALITAVRDKAAKELESQGLSPDELKLAKQLLADVLDVAEKTIDTKKVDAGVCLMLSPNAITFVAGGAAAETTKLEKVVKQIVELAARDEPTIKQMIKLDAETHQGVRFHVANVPAPEEEAKRFFGETIEVVLGVGEQALYLAVGRDASKTLKQAIDKSKAEPNKQIVPFKMAVAATPIAKMVAELAEGQEKQIAGMVSTMLQQAGGKDHVAITTVGVPNGARMRIEIEEGLLKILPMLAPMAAGGAGAAPGGAPGAAPPSPF